VGRLAGHPDGVEQVGGGLGEAAIDVVARLHDERAEVADGE